MLFNETVYGEKSNLIVILLLSTLVPLLGCLENWNWEESYNRQLQPVAYINVLVLPLRSLFGISLTQICLRRMNWVNKASSV